MTLQFLLVLLYAYIIGSIPSAYIVTYLMTGKDIRRLGNGNMGAKNTFESVGKLAGAIVFLGDITKGVAAVAIARKMIGSEAGVLLAGASAIVGHDFPFLLKFQGGQGMATTVGVFGALFPFVTAFAFVVFLGVLAISRNWDFSCFFGFVVLVLLLWMAGYPMKQVLYTIIILPILWITHQLQSERRKNLAH
jgi:glycerol-3-phosphate acyltransferase PlsY